MKGLAAVFAMALLMPAAASAEQQNSSIDAARTHHQRGIELYQAGDFEAAAEKAERIYKMRLRK